MLHGVFSPIRAHLSPQRFVAKQSRKMFVPFVIIAGDEVRLVNLGDVLASTHRTHDKRNSNGHVLHCFEARFAYRPIIFDDWVDADIE